MKLYAMPNSCALAPHVAVRWLGLPVQVEVLPKGAHREPAYLAVNPHGKVPALVLDGGGVLTEAAAVLPHLADLAPEAGLGGRDAAERARVAEALAWMTGEVHADWAPHFAPDRFLPDRALADEAGHAALEAATWKRLAPHYRELDARLAGDGHVLFGRRTVADAYAYVLARWADLLPGGIALYPALAAFRARMGGDAGVRAALHEQGLRP